jgi:hypothetical protein
MLHGISSTSVSLGSIESVKTTDKYSMTFELKVSREYLKTVSLMVATPMYGGKCEGSFTQSMTELSALCKSVGVQLETTFIFSESLVQRGRNACVDIFLRSACTHFLFIDADIGFDPFSVLMMLSLQTPGSGYDVLAAAYPKKHIAWDKVHAAVLSGVSPSSLKDYVGDFVFSPLPGVDVHQEGPVEVSETGTGFMMISREVFTDYDAAHPELLYTPDHSRTEGFEGSRQIMAYFHCIICPDTNRYLSEDYFFCRNVRKMGRKVWLCPWMTLMHTGNYTFSGSLEDLHGIGVAATDHVASPPP